MKERYSLKELISLPTLSVGQADNLKVDDGETRVWLCRCGVADGMPYNNMVTIEKYDGQRWEEVDHYQAL